MEKGYGSRKKHGGETKSLGKKGANGGKKQEKTGCGPG